MENYTGLFHVDSNVIDQRCQNTRSSFKNYTASTCRYTDEHYEAGLLEIHIPFSWVNLGPNNYIGIFDAVTLSLVRNGLIEVREGYYPTLAHLLDECNHQFKKQFYMEREDDFFPFVHFEDGDGTQKIIKADLPNILTYNPVWKRVIADISLGQTLVEPSGVYDPAKRTVNHLHIRFTPQLAILLGYESYWFDVLRFRTAIVDEAELRMVRAVEDKFTKQHRHMRIRKVKDFPIDLPKGQPVENEVLGNRVLFYAPRDERNQEHATGARQSQTEPRLKSGIEEVFIYCSIIKHHMIGNTFKQLLRVTPVFPSASINRGEPIVLTYDRPYYFPLFDTAFDCIEIELRDRAGELLVLESGSVIAVIEIRRKKHANELY